MEEGRKTVYAKCLCAKLDAYNRQISQTQKREEVWKGKERNYCGLVRVIFGNYADRTFYDGKKSFCIIE